MMEDYVKKFTDVDIKMNEDKVSICTFLLLIAKFNIVDFLRNSNYFIIVRMECECDLSHMVTQLHVRLMNLTGCFLSEPYAHVRVNMHTKVRVGMRASENTLEGQYYPSEYASFLIFMYHTVFSHLR